MRISAPIALTISAFMLAPAIAGAQININLPGVSVQTGEGGTSVSAPGVNVQTGPGGTRVDAPGTSVVVPGTAGTGAAVQVNANSDASVEAGDAALAQAGMLSATATQAEVTVYADQVAAEDLSITSIEATTEKVHVEYRQPGRLFGLIPITMRASVHVDAAGKVAVDLPWYAFLVASDIEALVQAITQSVTALGVSTGSVLTPTAQGQIIAAVASGVQVAVRGDADLSIEAGGASVNIDENSVNVQVR